MSGARAWIVFTAMCAGMFAAILDIQIVAAALPNIADALKTPQDQLSWIQTAYLIAEVVAIALSGRFTRALSTRYLFAAATAGFALTSLGCAFSSNLATLVVWRTLQGFCGGIVIPTVFSAGYAIFPRALQSRAVLLAGSIAMLAPTLGPLAGGAIAQRFSWHWLFLINVPLAVAVAAIVLALLDLDRPQPRAWKTIDGPALAAMTVALACFEIVLKLAPGDRWQSPRDYALLAATAVAGATFVRRCTGTAEALVDFSPLRDRAFAAACAFNAALGLGLYGSIYLLPLFLGFVRGHTALEIGEIMTVTGVAQLLAAPLAAWAERRFSATLVTGFGFALFAGGSIANAFENPRTELDGLILPQILRGASILFCILPITNRALDAQPPERLASASGVLNLLRNVGGAAGIGIVDTIVNARPASIGTAIVARLRAGDGATATFVGIPPGFVTGGDASSLDASDLHYLAPVIGRAAATIAFNEAWIVLGGAMLLSLAALPALRDSRPRPRTNLS